MRDLSGGYSQIDIVLTDNPEYIAFMRRMADRRPSRGGPRSAGEMLGGLVERCVRHWLSAFVPMQEERILTYEQRQRDGRRANLFRELDGVWQIDAESLCLFEMKLTFPENMERGVGIRQLNIAREILFASGRYQYILQRLVYISNEPIAVLEGLPVLEPNDEYAELGVIWVPPTEVEKAALELEITLPENWLEPESREGYADEPERDEWKQYVAVPEPDPEAVDPSNPLAEALRRAMGND